MRYKAQNHSYDSEPAHSHQLQSLRGAHGWSRKVIILLIVIGCSFSLNASATMSLNAVAIAFADATYDSITESVTSDHLLDIWYGSFADRVSLAYATDGELDAMADAYRYRLQHLSDSGAKKPPLSALAISKAFVAFRSMLNDARIKDLEGR